MPGMSTGQSPQARVYEDPPRAVETKTIRSAIVSFAPVGPEGVEGVTLVITPAMGVPGQPGQWLPVGEQIALPFDRDGWASFRDQVEHDGMSKRRSPIEVARALPPEPKL